MRGGKKMIYKNISFKAAPFSYELFFDDRITLVGGDSGTGKTVLYVKWSQGDSNIRWFDDLIGT